MRTCICLQWFEITYVYLLALQYCLPYPYNHNSGITVICVCIVLYLEFFISEDTHALVRFLDEDVTSIVPVQRVQRKETLEYGGSCSVVCKVQ